MKYVYGTIFALLVGALVMLILTIYVPVNVSLLNAGLLTLLSKDD